MDVLPPEPQLEVLDALRSALFVVAVDGRVDHANPAAARLLGRGDLVGAAFHDTVHASSHEDSPCPLLSALRGGLGAEGDADRFERRGGPPVRVDWTVDPLEDGRAVVTVVDAVASRDHDRAELWAAQQSVSDLGWIAELTRVMSSTMDEREALRRLARLVTPRLADVALVDILDDHGELDRVGGSVAHGVELDLDALLARADVVHVPGEPGRNTREVAGSVSVVRMSAAQMADPAVISAASRTLLGAIGARSMLVVPLAARNRTVGVAGLIRLTDDAYTDQDLLLAADIGRRAGLVLDNQRLYGDQERAAENLQRALLPAVRDTGRLQVAARYLPAADRLRVGGDWYDVFACPHDDDAHALVVGDVAGHDIAAATSMAAVRNLLRGIAVSASGAADPADVLTAVDTALPALDISGTATCLMIRAAFVDGRWSLTSSNAGHPPAVVVEPGRGPELLEVPPDPLLGTATEPSRHDTVRFVPTGTVLLLYTDGLVERRSEDLDVSFARLLRAVTALDTDSLTPDQVIAGVLGRMATVHDDDTAVLAVRLG